MLIFRSHTRRLALRLLVAVPVRRCRSLMEVAVPGERHGRSEEERLQRLAGELLAGSTAESKGRKREMCSGRGVASLSA